MILVPEARYHVDELGPLADELRARGIPVQFMTSPKTVPAALDELGRYTETVLPYAPEEIARARALVTLNDWGPLKQLVLSANEAGVPTFAKVEGVQDFGDVESSWERNPYRSASYILAQGDNDVAALPEKETFVVGSSRLERLWNAAPVLPGEHALVNLNFTFHVLTDQRDAWLDSTPTRCSARRRCRAGVDPPGRARSRHRPARGRQAVPSRDHQGRHPDLQVQHGPLRGDGQGRAVRLPQPARRAISDLHRSRRGIPGVLVRGRAGHRD